MTFLAFYFAFAFLCSIAAFLAYALVDSNTDWGAYATWLVAVNIVTFIAYGFDKLTSQAPKNRQVRMPEIILHLLAVTGGFFGAFAGMEIFHHKSNWGEHPRFPAVLALSGLGHLVFIYDWILKGS